MTQVHLVGSVALDSPEQTFALAGELLGPYLKRVPDGEPGGRRLWISWQIPVLRANPGLQPAGPEPGAIQLIPLRLADGMAPEELHFGELGYAREARPSYEDFLAARSAGRLPPGVRFQVALPTPYAVVSSFCTPEDAPRILPAYERAMLGEVERICAAIPHQDLALQWDVCIEMVQWDGRWGVAPPFPGMEQAFAAMFERLSQAVPADVELGFHLCYGDLDAQHFVQPVDATKMVELANLIVASAGRPVAFVHLPVPADRDDDAFFAPLQGLRLPADTELYLGLVHVSDGVEGTRRRMRAARAHAPDFGIASECGISRGRDANVADAFFRVYAGAAEAGPA
ncbi:MAG: hypothetical protein J2P40_04670 [Candidatus Dormibacteraeota bacterium]|nr:hypothetical protein [Candidatus Dormibacteraeota bacterium]MBO0760550.1 hypothetical protein [Candidatus Dormibacteraeota bacterium]